MELSKRITIRKTIDCTPEIDVDSIQLSEKGDSSLDLESSDRLGIMFKAE